MRSKSPSDTATLIARSILLSARSSVLSGLVAPGEEEATRQMLGARATDGWFGFAERHAWCRRCLMGAELFLLGGIFTHYLARKRWIEREVLRCLEDGIRQVVVLGAGYDALAWRLHRQFPEVDFFEIDHPATQAPKHAALAGSPNLHFLPANLASELPADTLAGDARFRRSEASVVIAEGLTMYFDKRRVEDILRSSAEVAGAGGRVVFTFMEAREDGSISFRGESPAIGWWLRLRKEPFRWGCKRDELAGFLRGLGLHLHAVANHRDLRSGILASRDAALAPLARGECLCLCNPYRS